jgi:hypothetical protein
MAVRFLTGPAVMAAASFAVGLRGTLLHVAIVQVLLGGEEKGGRRIDITHTQQQQSIIAALFLFPVPSCSLASLSPSRAAVAFCPRRTAQKLPFFWPPLSHCVCSACFWFFPFAKRRNEQAALPQGIVPFVFAKEYNVHPDILSTA